MLDGKKVKWNIPFKNSGSHREQSIWNEIFKIPYGETKSYKDIALKTNTSPRYVGRVCSLNKILLIIPCHRVIASNGKLNGYSGGKGIETKKELLNIESGYEKY